MVLNSSRKHRLYFIVLKLNAYCSGYWVNLWGWACSNILYTLILNRNCLLKSNPVYPNIKNSDQRMIGSPSNEKRTLKNTWNIQSHLPQAWCAFLRDCIAHVKRLMWEYVCPTKFYRYFCSYFCLSHVAMFLSLFTDKFLILKKHFYAILNYRYMVSIITVS